jgi:hypothetical protein
MSKIDLRLAQCALRFHLEGAQEYFSSASSEAQREHPDILKAHEDIIRADLYLRVFEDIAKELEKKEGVIQPGDVWKTLSELRVLIEEQHHHIDLLAVKIFTGEEKKPEIKCENLN